MKFFSFNRNYVTVLLTILFMVFLGAVYFFIYIPNNETRLQEQRFRTLQNINRNIHEKIKNSVALLNNVVQKDADTAYIKYLSNQSKENFSFSPLTSTGGELSAGEFFTDSGYTVKAHHDNRQVTLLLYKHVINAEDDTLATRQMAMKFSFEQFFKKMLPGYVFDGYAVFNNGQPIYETLPVGNDLSDSVFAADKKTIASAVRSHTISGIDYKLFLQPVSFIGGNDWAIAGLLSDKRYQQEKNQLPSNIILLLVTIVLAIIVSFPWIKLYQMGNKDRLTLTDGMASIAVSMLLMSLLFFSFFKYNTLLRPNDQRDSKAILAQQITNAFQNEIDTIYNKLNLIDGTVALDTALFKNSTKDNIKFGSSADSIELLKFKNDANIRQVFWLDSNGNEKVNWTSESRNAPNGNFSDRNYFKNILQEKDYRLNEQRRFYLDQVVSWTSGKFTSVLSIPSKVKEPSIAIAAISFTMKSLDDPVLPPGYQFAIIDKSGKVLYHSDASRNLNEDLKTEFSLKDRLTSSLEARTQDAFKTAYFGKDFNVLLKPINKLPYFIVVFSDLSFKATREMEIYSFTFSMLFLLFCFFILQLFIVFLVSSRKSFFKKQLYDTSWVGPKVSSHEEYNQGIIANVFVIFLALVFFSVASFLTYVFILLFSVTFTSLYLNSVFARKYKATGQPENYRFKIITIRWLFVLICIIDVTALKILDLSSIWLLLIYEVISLVAGFFFYYQGNNILDNARKHTSKYLQKKWTYQRSFAFMALARLIITSGIPVAFFYISAYNYEQNISIRYRQLQYANQLINKLDSTSLSKVNSNSNFDKGYYGDSVWVQHISIDSIGPKLVHSEEDSITSKILDLFRINFTDLAIKEDKFSAAHADDSSFAYNPLLKDACKKDSATKTYVKLNAPGKYLAIESAGLNYKLPSIFSRSWFNGLLFWILFLLALCIFFFIVYNIISKIFCLNLPNLYLCNALDARIIRNPKINNLLFVIGLPGSGKLSRIIEEIKSGGIKYNNTPLVYDEANPEANDVFIADLINIPDLGDESKREEIWKKFIEKIFNKKNRLIIVNHFEYNIQDPITNRIKLNFLEHLMLENRCKIIILSAIHPVAFLDSVMDPSVAMDKSVPLQDLERWHVLLGHYRIVVYPLRHKLIPKGIEHSYRSLYKETEHTHFLNKIQGCVLEVAREFTKNEMAVRADELIFKVQVTSHYFYMYIWQSLTKEEKFLMYDLAEDNLVNGYDDYNLNMLLTKGVIIRRNGTLTLFNRGFRNFILTAIGNAEAMKIKNRIQDNGNWRKLKMPLLIVPVAILTFLLASQKEAYSELMTYVAALGAGIPALLKLFSLFNKTEQKE